jgi:hypothetical protein
VIFVHHDFVARPALGGQAEKFIPDSETGTGFAGAKLSEVASTTLRTGSCTLGVIVERQSLPDGTAKIVVEGRFSSKEIEDPGVLPYVIARQLKIDLAQQQTLLECVNPVERLEKILAHVEAAN